MIVTFDIPDNAEDIVLMYGYKDAEGNWIRGGKTFIPKRCGQCGELNHDYMYGINPPEFKCEKYGCIVNVDSTCKGETNAEEQKAEQAAQ